MTYPPYDDRSHAGQVLADLLAARQIGPDAAILALTRGGVPVGAVVADRLHLPLDVVVVRKIGVPWQPELAMGAIAGTDLVLDRPMIHELGISEGEVERIVERERAGMANREEFFRGGYPALDLKGRTAILVDDGLATGSTMMAAIRHVRSLSPSRMIVAVPVGSDEACERTGAAADDVVCAATPHDFVSVGAWYRDFRQTEDREVRDLIDANRRKTAQNRLYFQS